MAGAIQSLIETIMTKLFAYEVRRHQIAIDQIVGKNSHRGTVLFKAKTYKPSFGSMSRRGSLDESLWPDMDNLIKDIDAVKWDEQRFWQLLVTLLTPCQTKQEVRDALPDFIVEMLGGELALLSRIDPEAWTILSNHRAMKQFTEAKERLELYYQIQKNPGIANMLSFYNFET